MLSLLWAFAERAVPRLSSALVLFVLARSVAPDAAGIYNWGILTVLLAQSMFDASVRQIAVLAVQSPSGPQFFRRYRLWCSTGGGLIVLAGSLLGGMIALHESLQALVILTPLAIIPLANAFAAPHVASLQFRGNWRALAVIQGASACLTLCISIPLIVVTGSIAGSIVQATLTEVLVMLAVRRTDQRLCSSVAERHVSDGRDHWNEFRYSSILGVFSWGQSQAERIAIAVIAGPGPLAIYSLSATVARSLGDVLAISATNVIRPELVPHAEASAHTMRAVVAPHLMRALALVASAALVVSVAATVLIGQLLPPDWGVARTLIPLVSLSGIPLVYTWVMTAVTAARGRLRKLVPFRLLGLVLAIPVGWLASYDLTAAGWAILGRETSLALLMTAAFGKDVPVRPALVGAVMITAGACACWGILL